MLRRLKENDLQSLDILVVGDDEVEAAKIVKVARECWILGKKLTFKDNLHNYIPGT